MQQVKAQICDQWNVGAFELVARLSYGADSGSSIDCSLTRSVLECENVRRGDQCPGVPGLRRDDCPLCDLKGQPIEEARIIRVEIRARVQALLVQEQPEITTQ